MKRSFGMVVVSLLVTGLWAHASRLCAWTYQTNGIPGTAAAQAVALSTSGDVFVSGYLGNPNDRASVVVRLSGTKGTEQWRQEFVSGYGDTADALAVDGAGGLIVAGRFQGRFAIRKLSQRDGSSLWIRKIDGSAEDSGLATAVTIDSAGDVFAVGWIT